MNHKKSFLEQFKSVVFKISKTVLEPIGDFVLSFLGVIYRFLVKSCFFGFLRMLQRIGGFCWRKIISPIVKPFWRLLVFAGEFLWSFWLFCDRKFEALVAKHDERAKKGLFEHSFTRQGKKILFLFLLLAVGLVVYGARIEHAKTMRILEEKQLEIEAGLYTEDIEPAYGETDVKVEGQDELTEEFFNSVAGKRLLFAYFAVVILALIKVFFFEGGIKMPTRSKKQ